MSDYLSLTARHYRRTGVLPEPERPSITFADFRQVVRRHRPSDLLPALAVLTLASGEPPLPMSTLATTPPWGVALVARESILWSNEHRRAGVDGNDLRVLFNAHNNIYEDVDVLPNASAVLPVMTRLAYEQFPYQESIFEEISRSHALLVEGLSQVETEVLTEETWEEFLGAPLGQVVGATFFLQVAANVNAGWFDDAWLDRADMAPIFERWPRDVIKRRAEDLSSTYSEFKDAYKAAPQPPAGWERYGYNPLTARPFVHMPDGRLLAPQPRLVLRTVSPGHLYYTGIQRLGPAFARDLGKLTERYVGRQLGSINDDLEVHGEITYGKPERKSVDWLIVLPSVVVLVEVKSARYRIADRAAEPGFENRTTSLLNKAISQLMRTAECLDQRHPAFAHIPTDRPRIGLVITGEPYYLANSPFMRDLLDRAPFPTLVASLRDIEFLAGLSIEQLELHLVGIANDPERSTWSLANALQHVPDRGRSRVLQDAWDSYPWPTSPTNGSVPLP